MASLARTNGVPSDQPQGAYYTVDIAQSGLLSSTGDNFGGGVNPKTTGESINGTKPTTLVLNQRLARGNLRYKKMLELLQSRTNVRVINLVTTGDANGSTQITDLNFGLVFENDDFVPNYDDWKFEERLSKEFEAVGFFISDHPLNQFKALIDDYNIVEFNKFIHNDITEETNITATLLKIQEKKTQKGNSYAIVKFSDLSSVFELFIFSEVLELNRDILIEGNSLLITLKKNISEDENRFKRINVRKIVSLKDLLNKPIPEIEFEMINHNKIEDISKVLNKKGNTEVRLKVKENEHNLIFQLKNKRFIERKSINLLKTQDILTNIK